MRSQLFARDMSETIVGGVIIIIFGGLLFTTANALARTGMAITIAGAMEIIVLMQIVRRRGRVDFASVPLKEFLLSEVQLLNRQISLLRHVAWWYLLPLYTGACVFVIGINSDRSWEESRTGSISFCVGYFIFCVFVWWLNQRARRKTLEPLRDAMQQTYSALVSLDSEAAAADTGLLDALANPALDATCRVVRFVRPSRLQIAILTEAGIGGAIAGGFVQYYSGATVRLEEGPLAGLIAALMLAYGILCVRRTGNDGQA
jgi:hypothetical protein